MHHLNAADLVVIVAYLAVVIALGLRFGKDQKTTRDYFLGSRNIPWWGVGLSIVATETSALTFIGVPAIGFGGNLMFIQIIAGYVIARVLLAIYLVPHYFRGEIYSPYQLVSRTFGPGARRTVSGLFLLAGCLAAGVRVYVTCIPLQLMLGLSESGIVWAILLFVIVSLIYTYVGGVKAVIWTDAIQFLLFMAGGVFTFLYIPTLLPGGWTEAWREAAGAGKLDWFNSGLSAHPVPILSMPFNISMGLIGATIQVLSSHGADQLIVQRVLTCPTVAAGRKSLILSAVIIFPLMLVFLLTGTMLWVYLQQSGPLPIPIPEARPGIRKDDYVFPIFILTQMPHWLRGFMIVAILSAAMSSVSSALSALASVSTMDLIKPLTGRGDAAALRLSRFSTVFWAGILVLVALGSRRVGSVLNLAFSLNGLTSGALLGGILLSLRPGTHDGRPVIVGMLGSLAGMLLVSRFLASAIGWPWFTLFGTALTFLLAGAAGVFFRRETDKSSKT